MYEQDKLPLDERRFVTPIIEETWNEYLMSMVVMPVLAYFFWMVIYAILIFVIFKKDIETHNYWYLY